MFGMRLAIAMLLTVLGCGSKDETPVAPDPVATSGPHPSPASSSTPATAARWTLTLSSDFGPCSEDDPRPCHQTWSVTSAGLVTRTEYPNSPSGKVATTTHQLSPGDRNALVALVGLTEFANGMAQGFPCQGGPAHDPDATLRLAFQTAEQYVERCTRGGADGGGDPANLVNRILRLLGR